MNHRRYRLCLLLIAFVSALLALQLAATPVHADDPTPQPVPTLTATPTPTATPAGPPPPPGGGGGLGSLLPDPKSWAGDVFNQVLVNLVQGVSASLHGLVGGVMSSSLNFITQTPPAGSYASPTVQTLFGVVQAIANAGLALVALWGGFNVITRPHLGTPYHEAMELFPRLILGALLVNTSLWWAQLAIDANNALCSAVGEASLPAWQQADQTTQLFVDVFSVLIYLVTSLLLLLQMLMRLALVNVLLVVAPLGLLCWVLPQTQSWARLWSGTFFSTVFVQFVQVLALKLGGSLITELSPMTMDASLLTAFLGIAVLVLTLKIPSLMRAHVGDGLGFARFVVYQQASRALRGGGGKGGAE